MIHLPLQLRQLLFFPIALALIAAIGCGKTKSQKTADAVQLLKGDLSEMASGARREGNLSFANEIEKVITEIDRNGVASLRGEARVYVAFVFKKEKDLVRGPEVQVMGIMSPEFGYRQIELLDAQDQVLATTNQELTTFKIKGLPDLVWCNAAFYLSMPGEEVVEPDVAGDHEPVVTVKEASRVLKIRLRGQQNRLSNVMKIKMDAGPATSPSGATTLESIHET